MTGNKADARPTDGQPDELDARGHRCPIPVIRTESALRRLAPGAFLRVLADDPLAAVDIPYFVREAGHRVVSTERREGGIVLLLQKKSKT